MQWLAEGEKPSRYFCALEHNNYVDKTIKCLYQPGENYIRDQKKMLNEIKNYYAKLYESTENVELFKWNEQLKNYQIKTMNIEQAKSIEGYLIIKEIGSALKNTKNNKTPGLDGFPSEFLKFFWKNLKFCITDAINFSFDKGCLPLTPRQCIVTCIPKKGKPRDGIKNWRPLSMLSVLYKLAPAAIANRMKPCLDQIIDKT